MLLTSCCLFLVVIDLPTINSFYNEQLRFTSLSQQEQNNELMFWLNNAWNSERSEFDHFRINGFDLCDPCFYTFYGISGTTWTRMFVKDAKLGSMEALATERAILIKD